MVTTPSNAGIVGEPAKPFNLPDPRTGNQVNLDSVAGQPFMLVFMCNHCPYVVHLLDGLISMSVALKDMDIQTIAISSNNIDTHPADSPEKMAELASNHQFVFPYLYDETQEIARAYGAVCTPDFYLYDSNHSLYYRGQFDDSRPGNQIPVTGSSMLDAAEKMLDGQSLPPDAKPSVGCSIKWKTA